MFAYVVVGLALLYLILHYGGVLEEYGKRQATKLDGEAKGRKLGLNGEIERRLKVFEDFFKDADGGPGDKR